MTTPTPQPSLVEAEPKEYEPPAEFSDTYYFPPFVQLQSEYHLGQPLYEDGEHWCLLAEIEAASNKAGYPFCLIGRDRTGDNFLIGFDLRAGVRFVPGQFKVGQTIAIVYAKRFNFTDGTKGIRVADLSTCHGFPFKLDRLLSANKAVCEYWETLDEEGRTKTCHACGREAEDLKQCSECGLYFYCNEDCRKVGWDKKKHNLDCEILRDPKIQELLMISTRETTEDRQFKFTG
ncbi:tannase subunit [Colletotrichum musicola]|uniref:Tannase subunit n=1 Tax=Colletotrichum musicola TaxID=2175873 RepID=A0A8H6KQK7_9PEZI|nr:tannase subunit [Colletotrichum musicola]